MIPGMFTYNGNKAKCVDGIVRTFHQTAEADTFFSVPGFVYVKGTRVYGVLYADNTFGATGKRRDLIATPEVREAIPA